MDSVFARKRIAYISAAASLGYITTLLDSGECGRQWWVTGAGLAYLQHIRQEQ